LQTAFLAAKLSRLPTGVKTTAAESGPRTAYMQRPIVSGAPGINAALALGEWLC
jgi:hypothetical protein